VIKKTICSATEQRQSEMRSLAQQVDAMIVVGGKNSANTQRLAKISQECGTPTQLVETEKDINWAQIESCKILGVTAGASTPNWMIRSIVDRLHQLAESKQPSWLRLGKRLFDVLASCNVYVATGAAAVYYTACKMQGFVFHWWEALLIFLYFLSMYLWNSLTSFELTQHHGISRYQFYKKHKMALFILSVVSIIALLAISNMGNKNLFYLMLFATMVGSIYHFTIVPKPLRRFIRYSNLKDIPTSRDLFVALAWAVLLTFIPQAESLTFTLTTATVLCFLWIFFLAFIRSLIFDLRDIEGDRIMGRETLVTIVGEHRARQVILTLLKILLAVSFGYSVTTMLYTSYITTSGLCAILQFPVILYLYEFIKSSRKIDLRHSSLFNVLADGQFFLSALLSLFGTVLIEGLK
jgi:4-hydroxybenzoate polyprenyltransferase